MSFLCSEKGRPPGLSPAPIDSLRLIVFDPEQGTRGAYVTWSYPENEPVTSFELYRSFKSDSMGNPIRTGLATLPRTLRVEIPDSSPPFTVYFGLQAVSVEATGQKTVSDLIALDSLRVLSPGTIHKPAAGTTVVGRQIPVEVRTGSDPGQTLRQLWFEKSGSSWTAMLDTCLPRAECEKPLFGTVTLLDTIVLGGSTVPIPTLFCVLATEAGAAQGRGLKQSLGCSRFERVE